jgi:integrase
MASLQQKGDAYYCQFMFGGKRHTMTIGEVSKTEAGQWKAKVEHLLMRIKQRLLDVPPGISITDFLLFDGKPPVDPEHSEYKHTTLGDLRDQYVATFSNGAIEANTLYTAKIHLAHLEETLGKRFLLSGLTLRKLQSHIDRRCPGVSPTTAKKEIDSFRAVWNWGERSKLVTGKFPSAGLVYPKTDEKLPFQSMPEIIRRLKAGGDPDQLWECLYLTAKEMTQLLAHVEKRKAPSWVYPMIATAAHTGARRSELIRAHVEDVDLAGGILTIREKKRSRSTRTTRRVPIDGFLRKVLTERLKVQKGKTYLFGTGDQPLSVQATQKAFVRIMTKSKWSVVRGWHVCRHSFVSACAMKGIPDAMLREWCGHQTAEMSRRYTHLLPSAQSDAIARVFG